MRKQSVSQTRALQTKGAPSEATKTRKVLLDLDVGQSVIFKDENWKLRSDISSYLSTFKRIGRIYSLRTLLTGERMIVRVK